MYLYDVAMVVGLHTLLCEVSDMDRSVAFYRDLLRFEVHYTSPYWSTLQIGSTRVGLHPAFEGNSEVKGGGWVFMLEASDIRGLRAKLEGAGVECSPYHDTPGGAIFNFTDPDGNRLQAMQAGVMEKDL